MACRSCGAETESKERYCPPCAARKRPGAGGLCFCVGCGETLGPKDESCPECRTPARGASFEETADLSLFGRPTAPKSCCCCLGDMSRTEEAGAAAMGLTFDMDLNWCEACFARKGSKWRLIVATAACGLVLALLLHSQWGKGGFILGAILTALAAGLAPQVAEKLDPGRTLRGHVPHCDAFGGVQIFHVSGQKFFARATFRNRAYADRFRQRNG
ncbi:MAG: hypothetical protein HY553_22415 [Elusimicrobia bacterium]|nr:hypothetical protein [Elusimicrobiota bacterium]